MRRLTTLATVLAVLVSGCARTTSEGDQVSSVVQRYFSSYASGSGGELCPLLTGRAQGEIVEVAESDRRELARPSAVRTCSEAVRFFGRVAEVKSTTVLAVSITATNATVTVKVGDLKAGRVWLTKTAAGWLFTKLPGST